MQRLPLLCALLSLPAVSLAQPVDWAAHYRKRVEEFQAENQALPAGKRHVVLVGDSLTEGWKLGRRVARYLPGIADRVLNRGISSDGVGVNARGVLHRLDASVFDTQPERIVLLIGVNDVGRDGSGVAPCARRYREVVKAIRKKLPDVPLHVMTVAPARGGYAALNPHIQALNRELEKIAREEGASLIDLHAAMADATGQLPAEFATDGLHWTDAGYERVGKTILAGIAPGGAAGAIDRDR